MELARPQDLWLLTLLPVALVPLWAWTRQRRDALAALGDRGSANRVSRLPVSNSDVGGVVLLLGALAVLILALSGPTWDAEVTRAVYREQDVVLILDNSLSMRATDVHPSRKARAKEQILGFLASRGPSVDRVGLVTFSGTSLITSYLSADVDNIFFHLDYMDLSSEPSYGTNIGSALRSALALVAKEAERAAEAGRDDPNQKVFLLLADGEDYGEELELAVAETVRAGIPVYAIGIGSDRDTPIPVEAPDSSYLLRDDDGRLVSARFDESTLRSIAQATGGAYHRSATGADLGDVMHDFLEAGRQLLRYENAAEPVELHPPLLLCAALLLAAAILL